jgi:hypothetical protein
MNKKIQNLDNIDNFCESSQKQTQNWSMFANYILLYNSTFFLCHIILLHLLAIDNLMDLFK